MRARRAREREIVDATRALFDERGLQDAPMDAIARAVGVAKPVIYRLFASKEELFVLTVTRYLDELADLLRAAEEEAGHDPAERLRALADRFASYCLEYPAFPDCALSLMRRPAPELAERVGEGVWVRIGQAMADCLGVLSGVLADGAARGAFDVEDPDLAANRLYAQTLGAMHLARLGVGVRPDAQGRGEAFAIEPDVIRRACVADALAVAGMPRDPART
jgi:AcrR family transcriptional regulator